MIVIKKSMFAEVFMSGRLSVISSAVGGNKVFFVMLLVWLLFRRIGPPVADVQANIGMCPIHRRKLRERCQ